jgi:hypothetical protein
MKRLRIPLLVALLSTACAYVRGPDVVPSHWWKGNLHTHSLWSDGADYPQLIAGWYRDAGYHFLAVTEHDMLQAGDMWIDLDAEDAGWPPRSRSAREAYAALHELHPEHADIEVRGGRRMIRLRGLAEYRHLFEAPQRFLLIMGQEITDAGGAHVNAINLPEALLPRGGASAAARTRNNLDAVAALRERSGVPIMAIVNHPNFVWALTADDIATLPHARFFELRSGHTMTNDDGDATRPGTERLWDIVLTRRHIAGLPPIYGVGSDDAHDYRSFGDTVALPGRAWVMVRAPALEPGALIEAMERGDFYVSTGVTLRDMTIDDSGVELRIEPEQGALYVTRFIGALTDAPDDAIGLVLKEVHGPLASYRFSGNERYVRAVVTSSLQQHDPVGGRPLGPKRAWTQPVMR